MFWSKKGPKWCGRTPYGRTNRRTHMIFRTSLHKSPFGAKIDIPTKNVQCHDIVLALAWSRAHPQSLVDDHNTHTSSHMISLESRNNNRLGMSKFDLEDPFVESDDTSPFSMSIWAKSHEIGSYFTSLSVFETVEPVKIHVINSSQHQLFSSNYRSLSFLPFHLQVNISSYYSLVSFSYMIVI